jgi:glycosyltransferase involved in cell wall biosynthesis
VTRDVAEAPAPTVTIIVPAYNVAPYIGEALASVMTQTRCDYEVIVVNDGSTDDLEAAIAAFRTRIVYIRQENGGVSAARNAALRVARGRYITLLDGDDVWMPDYLERLLGRLEADPSIDVIHPNAVVFGEPRLAGKLIQDMYPPREPITFERLLTRECMVFGSLIFKRELIDRVGMFDEGLRYGEDFDMWLRMARLGYRFALTREPLVRYRRRAGSSSTAEVAMARAVVTAYEKILHSPDVTARERQLIPPLIAKVRADENLALSKQMILVGEFERAAHHLALANSHYRHLKLRLVAVLLRVAPSLLARLLARRQGEASG